MSPQISVIIVNFNAGDSLRQLLKSLQAFDNGYILEIFIVDNNSTDNSVARLRKEFSFINIIQNAENVGFAKANNQGVKQASSEKVLLINPDAEIKESTLRYLAECLEKNSTIGIAGPKILKSDGTIQKECARSFPGLVTLFLGSYPLINKFSDCFLKKHDYKSSGKVACVSGACMMVRKKIFNEIGGFDERFFMYGEDMDLCYRVVKGGYKVWYVSEAEVMHLGGVSTKQNLYFESCKSIEFFFRKNQGFLPSLLYRLGVVISLLPVISGLIIWHCFNIKNKRSYWRGLLSKQVYILIWAITGRGSIKQV